MVTGSRSVSWCPNMLLSERKAGVGILCCDTLRLHLLEIPSLLATTQLVLEDTTRFLVQVGIILDQEAVPLLHQDGKNTTMLYCWHISHLGPFQWS